MESPELIAREGILLDKEGAVLLDPARARASASFGGSRMRTLQIRGPGAWFALAIAVPAVLLLGTAFIAGFMVAYALWRLLRFFGLIGSRRR